MALDKWIAMIFLAVSLVYGYASYSYPLLPFERTMVFLPNTMPLVLSVFGVLFSLIILCGRKTGSAEGEALGEMDMRELRRYKTGQALALIGGMVLYALALRPAGFIAATVLFLIGSGWVLGERKLLLMIATALIGALVVWFLVQQALGIYLRPLPWFIG